MKSSLKINLPLLIGAVIALLGMFVGSYLDKDIAYAVGNQSNAFAILFTAIGDMPTFFIGIFAGSVVLFKKCKTDVGNVFAKLFGIGIILVMNMLLLMSSLDYADFEVMKPHSVLYKVILVVFVLAANVVIMLLTKKFAKNCDEKVIFKIAVLIVSIIGCYVLSLQFLKYVASRPRPRVVIAGIQEYRQWYEWKPFYCFTLDGIPHGECNSFISGHAANSACLLTLLPLFIRLTNLKEKSFAYTLAYVIGLLFTLVVSLSRLIAEAHFLSDVMGGILVSIFFQSLCLRVVPIIVEKITKKFEK